MISSTFGSIKDKARQMEAKVVDQINKAVISICVKIGLLKQV